MFRSSKIFCDHQFFKHNVIWLPNTAKSNVQLFTNCVLWLKIIASLVHAHEFYFTLAHDHDVPIFSSLTQLLILSRLQEQPVLRTRVLPTVAAARGCLVRTQLWKSIFQNKIQENIFLLEQTSENTNVKKYFRNIIQVNIF